MTALKHVRSRELGGRDASHHIHAHRGVKHLGIEFKNVHVAHGKIGADKKGIVVKHINSAIFGDGGVHPPLQCAFFPHIDGKSDRATAGSDSTRVVKGKSELVCVG